MSRFFVLVRRPPPKDYLKPDHRSYGPFEHELDALSFSNRATAMYPDAITIVEPLRTPESLS